MLWLAAIAMTAIVSASLTVPLVRAYDAHKARPRLTSLPPPKMKLPGSILAVGGLVVGAVALAAGLYFTVGRPSAIDAEGAAAQPVVSSAAHPGGDISSMVGALEIRMKQNPGDAAGWRMLGWSYMQTGRYADAVTAYGKVLTLAPGSAADDAALGEALTRTAGGAVTPPADEVFHKALSVDPREPRARYSLAVAKEQRGDHAGAMSDWIDLLRSAPPDAPWIKQVRDYVEQVARADGEDIAGRLPTATLATRSNAGLTATPAAADAGSGAMIERMVDSLESRLKSDPRNPDGWVQLIRSRMVLGEMDKAATAYRHAWLALADSPAQQDQVQTMARALHVPGA